MMTPSLFVRHARQHLEGLANVEVQVHGRRWARREKMGLFLSVASGSERGLRFLCVRYRGTPDTAVDLALVGAIAVALGSVYSGVFSNCSALAEWIVECGARTGDLVWQMPLDERYRQQLDSRVADMKNCGTRYGGACVAASFLREFVGENTKWAHVDIAGVDSNSCFSELYGKGPTGRPVRMLISLIEKMASCRQKGGIE
ncbi:UNVERIFIED_CONTAM: hypothetical protein PYX00_011260 [Menopon gallinae]|uniref:Cytosol aminopeptidase domain-containing protein n=1 Tax=Menopon gallinae TaxID=328185 RepID=A0AAW2H7D2_9NEOP